MSIWSREARYRPLSDVDPESYRQMKEEVRNAPWRFRFHIQPPTGLLNDPNGFVHHDGTYHLFYQWFPLGPVHGLKYWYHLTSKNLVDWFDEGAALIPNDDPDSHGAFSGSGFVKDGQVHIMYTGNKRDADWNRHTSQIVGRLRGDGRIEKFLPPAIPDVPEGYTEHFRDPKVWQEDGVWYCVIGAQRSDLTGCVVLFRSQDAYTWTMVGELKTTLPDFGYMWECPDYFVLDGTGFLLFCPQGLVADGDRFHNVHQSGYVQGAPLDLPDTDFQHGPFQELDFGFDFYAPQTTLSPDGRRLLVGWMGLPDTTYPSDRYNWANALTLPRELKVVAGRLLQTPARELETLRKETIFDSSLVHSGTSKIADAETFELVLTLKEPLEENLTVTIRAGEEEETLIQYDASSRLLSLDRTRSGQEVASESFGTVRRTALSGPLQDLRLFVDSSSIELFANSGEAVATARIFPKSTSTAIKIDGEFAGNVSIYDL